MLSQIEAKNQANAAKAARKLQVEADRQTRRGNIASGVLQVTYSGALGSKNMDDLRDIAWGLGLKEEGLKADYVKAIKDHLDLHPNLRDHPRWVGLYQRGQRRPAPGTGNAPTPLFAGSTSLPSPASAHARFADSVPNVVALNVVTPNYGTLSFLHSIYPPQYIRYSSEFINKDYFYCTYYAGTDFPII